MARLTDFVCSALEWRDVSFAYPEAGGKGREVLRHASLEVGGGAFCLLTGATGAGKTTLLRLAKPEVAPAGDAGGSVTAFGRDVRGLAPAESAGTIGYVSQVPSTQTVCDSVWHELAFGLENLGLEGGEMRRRVAEACYFLGIECLLHRRTDSLSGGELQMVALASVLVMEPRVLLLDEPTAMLDPIARDNFAHALFRLNRELGITVVVATHEPWALAPYATMAARVADGRVGVVSLGEVSDGPSLLASDARGGDRGDAPLAGAASVSSPALVIADAWQRYGREEPWVLRGCAVSCAPGEVHALVGGNGSGKSTLLRVAAGILRLSRGTLANSCTREQALLPQQAESLLTRQTVGDELMAWSRIGGYDMGEAMGTLARLGLGDGADGVAGSVAERDPLDLSRGQRQLVALAKVLLVRPRLLLCDEPTLGLDLSARRVVARELRALASRGSAVVVATHDLGLAREATDVTSMVFDGGVACTLPSGEFFRRNVLYR